MEPKQEICKNQEQSDDLQFESPRGDDYEISDDE